MRPRCRGLYQIIGRMDNYPIRGFLGVSRMANFDSCHFNSSKRIDTLYQADSFQISNFWVSVLKPMVPVLGFDGRPAEFQVAIFGSPTRMDKPLPIPMCVDKFFDNLGFIIAPSKFFQGVAIEPGRPVYQVDPSQISNF